MSFYNEIILDDCIQYGYYNLRSEDMSSNWKFEAMKLFEDNNLLEYVIEELPYKDYSYAGIVTGGALLSAKRNIPSVIVEGSKVFGPEPNKIGPVILFDDVITTGTSIRTAIDSLKNFNYVIADVYCLVNRGSTEYKSLISKELLQNYLRTHNPISESI